MTVLILYLQIGSVLSGLAGAVLWWLSAQAFWGSLETKDPQSISGSRKGDMMIVLPDGTHRVELRGRVALTNAWAAGLSGLAVFLQAVPTILQIVH